MHNESCGAFFRERRRGQAPALQYDGLLAVHAAVFVQGIPENRLTLDVPHQGVKMHNASCVGRGLAPAASGGPCMRLGLYAIRAAGASPPPTGLFRERRRGQAPALRSLFLRPLLSKGGSLKRPRPLLPPAVQGKHHPANAALRHTFPLHPRQR